MNAADSHPLPDDLVRASRPHFVAGLAGLALAVLLLVGVFL